VIEAVKNSGTPYDCQSSVCVGNGSLNIYIDGNLIIKPGDYSLKNVGGRTGSGLRSHWKLYEQNVC